MKMASQEHSGNFVCKRFPAWLTSEWRVITGGMSILDTADVLDAGITGKVAALQSRCGNLGLRYA
jgi:hypothetical protein